jgi:hypothetical protein
MQVLNKRDCRTSDQFMQKSSTERGSSMKCRIQRSIAGLFVLGTMLVGLSSHAGESPTLTAPQQEKLKKIQAMFVPGGPKPNTSGGYGWDKLEEFCGQKIPMEIHPTTAAYEKKKGDRTDIDSLCDSFAGTVAYTCGYEKDADPVVKEIIRKNVKRTVCKSTENAADFEANRNMKFALENGTFTFTYLANNASDPGEAGMKFLRKNAFLTPNGLSIGGQQLKRKMFEDLSPRKATLHQRLKEQCGIENLTVAIDDKLAEHYSYHLGYNANTACDAGLQSVYNLCGRGDEFSKEYNTAAVRAAAQKYMKGISCVYSDTESIAIKPGGILELGVSRDAPRPKWQGKTMMSIHDYYMGWLSANHASFAQPGSSSAAAASSSSPPSKPKLLPRKRKP